MGDGLNKPVFFFFPKMSTDVLYFSFSRSALAPALAHFARALPDVFEKNEKKNKTNAVYRLLAH